MSFDRVAWIYRGLERVVFGNALQESRIAHLDVTGDPSVLILGDGDGRFLEALLKKAPGAKVEVVEASATMIQLARRRVMEGAEVVFHHLEVAEFIPCKQYDLVASHFFLDCFEPREIEQIAAMVTTCLGDGACWLISDFQLPRTGVLRRTRARLLLWVMYRFFRVTTGIEARDLIDPEPILRSVGLRLVERLESNAGFLRADHWA